MKGKQQQSQRVFIQPRQLHSTPKSAVTLCAAIQGASRGISIFLNSKYFLFSSVLGKLVITSSQLSCLAKCSLAIPVDIGWSRKDKAQISPCIPKLSLKKIVPPPSALTSLMIPRYYTAVLRTFFFIDSALKCDLT